MGFQRIKSVPLHRVSNEIRIFLLLNLSDAFARISLGVRLYLCMRHSALGYRERAVVDGRTPKGWRLD